MNTQELRTTALCQQLFERRVDVDARRDWKIACGGHDVGDGDALEVGAKRPLQLGAAEHGAKKEADHVSARCQSADTSERETPKH